MNLSPEGHHFIRYGLYQEVGHGYAPSTAPQDSQLQMEDNKWIKAVKFYKREPKNYLFSGCCEWYWNETRIVKQNSSRHIRRLATEVESKQTQHPSLIHMRPHERTSNPMKSVPGNPFGHKGGTSETSKMAQRTKGFAAQA